jgi:hypothetical protein
MLWTVLTVVIIVLALIVVLGVRICPGKETFGDAQEQRFRLWTGF